MPTTDGAGERQTMPEVLSYGGGRQTVAMVLLVLHELLPRPDLVLIADTGREARSTWEYLDAYVRPALADARIPMHVAPHSLATVDCYSKGSRSVLLPVYTATGKLQTWCSNEWKAYVCQRYLRSLGIRSAVSWIGFTVDESHRDKGEGKSPWWRAYPLIDQIPMTRTDCELLIERLGWPLPAKSACYCCPHRNNAEWRFIRDTYPDQWQAAIALDQELRDEDEQGGVWLHQSRVPLAEADLDAPDRREPNRQCALGLCWI